MGLIKCTAEIDFLMNGHLKSDLISMRHPGHNTQ